jgi:hypothetical protein
MSATESGPDVLDSFDPIDTIRVLTLHEVRFVLIGGLAAAVAGAPVPTAEIEVCYDRSPSNLVALSQALSTLRAEPNPDSKVLVGGGRVWCGTRNGELQLVGIPDGTTGFDDIHRGSVQLDLGDGLRVNVAGLADQIRIAASSARVVDRARVDILRAVAAVVDPA